MLRIKAAKFPTVKSLDSFDFKAIPGLNKIQVLELARCEWTERTRARHIAGVVERDALDKLASTSWVEVPGGASS